MTKIDIDLNDPDEIRDLLDKGEPKNEERLINTQDFDDEDENDTTPSEAEEQIDEEEKRHKILEEEL